MAYQIQWEWENIESSTSYSGVWGIPIHPSLAGVGSISVPPPLQGGFCLVLISTRLGITLVPFCGCLSPPCVMTRVLWLLRLKTPAQQDMVKKYLILPHFQELSRHRKSKLIHNLTCCAGSLKDLVFPTRVHMCYQCFCSTIVSMLPKKY